ncbi:MAG: BatA domain-containing protein, partial [Pirellulaceae bacterium]
MIGPILAAWIWGSAWMLAWGLAVAIPLAIHWWSRRRFQETPWAAMEFLLAALRKSARRIRLEQYLLLALRVGAVALFALALADPRVTGDSGASAEPSARHTHWIVVLDTSGSMEFRLRDDTRLEAARQAARRWLADSEPGDGYSLVLLQDVPQVPVGDPVSDPEVVRREIDRASPSRGGADLAATWLVVDQLVEHTRQQHAGLDRTRIGWFTDLGQATWNAALTPDVRQGIDRLAARAQLEMFDVGRESAPNWALAGLERDRSLVTLGDPVEIIAEVRGFAAPDNEPRRVEFLVDGRVVGFQEIRVPSQGSTTAVARITFAAPGESVVEARLPGDALAYDNQRWMVVPVHAALRVLCVQGEPDAAEYVALALAPFRDAESSLQVEVVSESVLLERPLASYDCVVLNNIATFSSEEADVLYDYIAAGGGLITVLGDRVQSDNYNRELGEGAGERRLLPATLGERVRAEETYLDPLNYEHPLTRPFRGFERAGLLTAPTWRYIRLQPRAGPEVQVALRFDTGDAAVIGQRVARGRSMLVATALSPSSREETAEGAIPWSALPSWPSFPPLVHGLVRWAVDGRAERSDYRIHQPVVIPAPPDATSVRVTRPDGTSRSLPDLPIPADPRVTFVPTQEIGVYEFSFPGSTAQGSPRKVAVNGDTRESDPARVEPEMLPSG